MSTDRIAEYHAQFAQTRTQMIEQLRRVVIGQTDVIEQILAATAVNPKTPQRAAVDEILGFFKLRLH